MLDNLSKGRIIAGFVRGIGSEYHSSGINPYFSHERFHEAHDLIIRAWTEPGPFAFDGEHFSLRYVNLWPRPYQNPHPPVWIPSQGSSETVAWAADPEAQVSVPGDLLVGRPGGALPQHLSRAGAAIRLRGRAGSARLGLADLCRRDRRARPRGGRAGGRDTVQRFPAPDVRDADAAGLHLDALDEEFHAACAGGSAAARPPPKA